jgi:hypothetical protein
MWNSFSIPLALWNVEWCGMWNCGMWHNGIRMWNVEWNGPFAVERMFGTYPDPSFAVAAIAVIRNREKTNVVSVDL